ncbi:MAG: helix-turn-helix domain-containing protein [Candidatus Krumholzibacteria bacterium]
MSQRQKSYLLESAAQRTAVSSPIRLEILGQFTSPGGMSIAEVAERMGRPAATLYYHFRILEKVGLLVRTGSRPGTKKSEALYEPVANRFEFPVEPDSQSAVRAAIKTLSLAFRMAERDLESALTSGTARTSGKHRNAIAGRLHCRTTRSTLAEINQHLRAIEKIFEREGRRVTVSPDADEYLSFTLALLPLRGRGEN